MGEKKPFTEVDLIKVVQGILEEYDVELRHVDLCTESCAVETHSCGFEKIATIKFHPVPAEIKAE